MTEVSHPVIGVEIGKEVALARVAAGHEIADIMGRLRRKELPGFVIPAHVARELEADGRDVFDVLTDDHGFESRGDELIGTKHNPDDPLHTDKPHLIPDGATTRMHQIQTDHRTTISMGRLDGHDGSVGTEYRQDVPGAARIAEMHVGEAGRGDVSVFELSGDVAHRYSSPEPGQKRDSRIRSIGPKTTS